MYMICICEYVHMYVYLGVHCLFLVPSICVCIYTYIYTHKYFIYPCVSWIYMFVIYRQQNRRQVRPTKTAKKTSRETCKNCKDSYRDVK